VKIRVEGKSCVELVSYVEPRGASQMCCKMILELREVTRCENKSWEKFKKEKKSPETAQHSATTIAQQPKPMTQSKSKVLVLDPMLLERRRGTNIQALVLIVIMVVVVIVINHYCGCHDG